MTTRSEYWNRSSAFTPEVLAGLIAAQTKAVQSAVVEFSRELSGMSISDEERAEAIRIVAEDVSKGIADAIEGWKDESRNPAVRRK